jgi:hypothetical protein
MHFAIAPPKASFVSRISAPQKSLSNGRRSKFSKNDEMFIDEERLKGSTQGSFQPRAFRPRPLVRRLADRLILSFKEENAGKNQSR